MKDVAESLGVHDGGGSYVDLHTREHVFGLKVEGATVAVYLKRFGESDEQLNTLWLMLSKKSCCFCGKKASTKCRKCKSIKYCSKKCQKSDYRFFRSCYVPPLQKARKLSKLFF